MDKDPSKQKARKPAVRASNQKPRAVKTARKAGSEFKPAALKDEENDNGASLKGIFMKDLPIMMYGFGDAQVPLQQTVELVEDITLKYVSDLLHSAMDHASTRGKLTCNDLLYMVRKDARKYTRAKALLYMNEELKKARKAFEDNDELGNMAEDAAAEGDA